jgi:hypothetical protein
MTLLQKLADHEDDQTGEDGRLTENPIDRHTPTRQRRFSVRGLATVIRERLSEIRSLVDMNAFGYRVDIPNNLSAGSEVVRPFVGHLGLGRSVVVILAPNFGRKGRWALDKAHRIGRQRAVIVRSIR